MELDENSHLSADSRISDSNSMQVRYSERSGNAVVSTSEGLITHFSKEMFQPKNDNGDDEKPNIDEESKVPKLESFNSEYIIPETEHFSESEPGPINKGNFYIQGVPEVPFVPCNGEYKKNSNRKFPQNF